MQEPSTPFKQPSVCENPIKRASGLLATIALSVTLVGLNLAGQAHAANSVSQYGITWTFSEDRTVGQFANGDWWVLGPVTITNISPKTGDGGITYSNGSMINPIPGESQTQGFYLNGTPGGSGDIPKYDAAKNISLHLPVTVGVKNSVYSTMNNPDTWKGHLNDAGVWVLDSDLEKTWFKETAVLTVLAAVPPAGSFRPPYAGTDKTIKSNWNVDNLDFSVLRSLDLPVPANAPSLTWLEEATKRPLIEMAFGYTNSNFKASWAETKPGGYPRRTYGREIGGISGGAALMLNTNLTNAQKRKLAIHMVQWGIDTYGLLENGMQYWGSGGHQLGRLAPLYIAGKMLNDPQILAKVKSGPPLQELSTHFYVTQQIIDIPRSNPAQDGKPNKPYTTAMLGKPEWCISYPADPYNSSAWNEDAAAGWHITGYRYLCGSPTMGTVAAILLMGGRSEVNQEAFFDYHINLYYPNQRPTGNGAFSADSNGVQPFVRDMWDVYISGSIPKPVNPPPVAVTFSVGDWIKVWRTTIVNSTAAMTSPIGSQAIDALGKIVQGPVGPDNDNITWYKVDYESGPDGWCGVDNFIKSSAPSSAAAFSVGDRVQVNFGAPALVYATAATTTPTGSQAGVGLGTIVSGPVSAEGISWYQINYDNGVDGWSMVSSFAKSYSPPYSSFAVGNRIQTWRITYVNGTASTTTPLGQQPSSAQGTIVEGPAGPDDNNIVWFKINYDSGVDGWSGADSILKSTSTQPATPPSKPTGLKVVE